MKTLERERLRLSRKKRIKLKKIIMNKKLELAERFAAQLKLDKLPKIKYAIGH